METPVAEFRFGPFRLDPTTLELSRDDRPVPLEPLPARILVRLVERAGDLVSRRELRELGWPRLPDAAEQSLNTCVRQIRDALGDDAADPAYVETLRGRGYRFRAPVHAAGMPGKARPDHPGPSHLSPPRIAAVLVLLAVAVAAVLSDVGAPTTRLAARVVVEPAEVEPGGGDAALVGQALTTEVRAALAAQASDRLEVLGRESTERVLAEPGRDWGRLAATHRLILSVREPEHGEYRVVARFEDLGAGTVVWGAALNATPATLGPVATELARELAATFGIRPHPRDTGSPALSLEDRRRLLSAEHLLRTHGDPKLALAFLDTVAALRSDLADGAALRAEALLRLERYAEAFESAERALGLAPGHTGALRARAGVEMIRGEWTRAEASLRTALGRAPHDPSALSALAFLLTVRSRFAEAQDVLQRSLRMDPLSAILVGDAGLMHFWAGRHEQAARLCRESMMLDDDAAWALGCAFNALYRSGHVEQAAELGREILAGYGAPERIPDDGGPVAVVREVLSWRVDAWKESVRRGYHPYDLALAYADAGLEDEALGALEDASARPTLGTLPAAVDPRLAGLRDEPRFRSVLRRLALER